MIKVNIGFEAKVIDQEGNLDIPFEIQNLKNVSIVAAIHRIPIGKREYIRRKEINVDLETSFENLIKSIESLKKNSYINRIAHPNSLLEYFSDDMVNYYWQKLDYLLSTTQISLELNAKYNYPKIPVNLLRKHILKSVVGSDSHSVQDLEERFELIKTLNFQIINYGGA